MKKPTNTKYFIRLSLAVAVAVAIWTPLHSQSAEPGEGKMLMNDKMMERCQGMMKLKQKLNEDTNAQDVELTEQVALRRRFGSHFQVLHHPPKPTESVPSAGSLNHSTI